MNKKCSKCKLSKTIDNFNKDKQKKSGLCSVCKVCHALYRIPNKLRTKIATNLWRNENREKQREHNRNFYYKNKEASLRTKRLYRKNNPEKFNFYSANYRAQKIKATPKWLNNKQIKEIQSFYVEANLISKKSGIQFDVDHIIPLRGKTVSGLHVPWNLQILEHISNCKKRNRI